MMIFWLAMVVLLIFVVVVISIPLLKNPKRSHLIIVLVLVPAIGLTAFWLYGDWGNRVGLMQYQREQKLAASSRALLKEVGGVDELITRMKAALEKNPRSAKGWYLLGRLYLSQQQYPLAQQALAKANELEPDDAVIMMEYAQALVFNQGNFDGKPRELLVKASKLAPENLDIQNLLALADYQQGHYRDAINRWEKISQILPEGSDAQKVILQAIHKAQQKLKSE